MVTQMNFKYRIYPSRTQIIKLNKTLSDCCLVYNKLLETKINAYKTDKTNITQFDLNKLAKDIDVPVHSQVKQNISKRINDAFNHFFRRVKQKKGKVGFPRFKSLNKYKSITYPQNGFKLISNKKLFVSKIGTIPIVLDRIPKGKLKTFCIKKTAIGWFAIFSCADVPVDKIKVEDNHVGIDVGIENFATLSNGEVIANPTFLRKSQRKLNRLQRRMSRKKKGSANRRKARFKVARLHERIFNQRQDFLHKTSFNIIKRFKTISVEKLIIKNMVKNHHLAKSINDASWGSFIQMLSYKVARTGGQLIKVNPRNTSRTCSNCGSILDMPLSKRTFKCKCGFVCHRDLNASININTAGQAEINACGLSVRPSSLKAVEYETGTIFESA
jgi:putative transposase